MKYFTPELYVEYNSRDPIVADHADQAWERAVANYRARLKKIRKRLPPSLRDFAEKTSLHDGAYLGYLKTPVPKTSGELAIVAVEQHATTLLLIYVLVDEPTLSPPLSSPFFPEQDVQWLYDEIDEVDDVLTHDILLSNGQILHIRFAAFDMLAVGNHQRPNPFASSTRVLVGN